MTDFASRDDDPNGDQAQGADDAAADRGRGGTPGTATDSSAPVGAEGATGPEAMEEALTEAELDAALDRLQSDFDELNDRHLRLAAEFNNYRRRVEGEMSGAWDRAQADLVRRLLDVLDDLQRVAELDPADAAVTVESIVEGIDLVERKFVKALKDAGAETVSPAPGSVFNPETMEAMMRVPVDDADKDDTVAQVFQQGYSFRDHLVRPARVSVHKAD